MKTTTLREKQILRLLLQGCDNATIAKELGIAIGTIKTACNKLFLKFQIHDGAKRVQLAVLFFESSHLKFADRRPRFSEKQRRVIELVAAGKKNAQISEAIGTTEQVIKNSLHAIYDALGLWTRVEVALWFEARRRARLAASGGCNTTSTSEIVAPGESATAALSPIRHRRTSCHQSE